MDEIMDQLNQVIEERVLELKRKSEEDKVPAYCTETKEHVLRMDRILNSLSEDDRQWLDDQLMAKMDIPEQERLRYYKAGLADAIELRNCREIICIFLESMLIYVMNEFSDSGGHFHGT